MFVHFVLSVVYASGCIRITKTSQDLDRKCIECDSLKSIWQKNRPIFYKNKPNQSRQPLLIGVIILKITMVSLVPMSVILCVSCLTRNFLKVFPPSKFLNLSTGLLRWRSPKKIAAKWRYRLPIKNMTPHHNSQFCVCFNFCVDLEVCRRL